MKSIRHNDISKPILKEFNYDFGDVFVLENIVVSEIAEGVTFSWDDHAWRMIQDITTYRETDGSDLVYISHRIHSYSVVPQDWLKFYKHFYDLRAYYVVSYQPGGMMSYVIENLFFRKKIRRFTNIHNALNAVQLLSVMEMGSDK